MLKLVKKSRCNLVLKSGSAGLSLAFPALQQQRSMCPQPQEGAAQLWGQEHLLQAQSAGTHRLDSAHASAFTALASNGNPWHGALPLTPPHCSWGGSIMGILAWSRMQLCDLCMDPPLFGH